MIIVQCLGAVADCSSTSQAAELSGLLNSAQCDGAPASQVVALLSVARPPCSARLLRCFHAAHTLHRPGVALPRVSLGWHFPSTSHPSTLCAHLGLLRADRQLTCDTAIACSSWLPGHHFSCPLDFESHFPGVTLEPMCWCQMFPTTAETWRSGKQLELQAPGRECVILARRPCHGWGGTLGISSEGITLTLRGAG